VAAFNQLRNRRLIVVGDGPELPRLRAMAGSNITFTGYLSSVEMGRVVGGARAFVFAAREDFGIAPIEAQAAGTPVVAFSGGGAREGILPGVTGILFDEQTAEGVLCGIESFEKNLGRFDPGRISAWADRFSAQRFRQEFMAVLFNHYQRKGLQRCDDERGLPSNALLPISDMDA